MQEFPNNGAGIHLFRGDDPEATSSIVCTNVAAWDGPTGGHWYQPPDPQNVIPRVLSLNFQSGVTRGNWPIPEALSTWNSIELDRLYANYSYNNDAVGTFGIAYRVPELLDDIAYCLREELNYPLPTGPGSAQEGRGFFKYPLHTDWAESRSTDPAGATVYSWWPIASQSLPRYKIPEVAHNYGPNIFQSNIGWYALPDTGVIF